MTTILIIEDDARLSAGLVSGLREAGFEVSLAYDGPSGDEMLSMSEPDLLILDLMMPRQGGFWLLERWSARLSCPVLVLTARTDLDARLRAFELGARDYAPKPFFMEELLARVRVQLGEPVAAASQQLCWANARLDRRSRRLWVDDQEVRLTPHELNLGRWEPGGDGLGLAITAVICRRMGWSLRFSQNAPRGLCVRIKGSLEG